MAAALLAAVPLTGAAQEEEDGGTFLERTIEDSLSGDGTEVRVTGFRGVLSSEATLERMTIADEQGIWLTLEDVTLDWNRFALVRGRFSVNTLRAGSIDLPRLPAAGEGGGDVPAPEAPGFRLPELPVSVRIGEVVSPSISIGAPVLGVAAEFSLEGALTLEDGEGEGTLDIVRIDGQEGELRVDAAFSNATRVLDISVLLDEAPGGILATVAGLPGAPSVELSVDGEGPLDDFAATLMLATDGVERLAGDVTIGGEAETGDGAVPFTASLAGDVAPLFLPEYAEFFGPRIALELEGARQADGAIDFDRFALGAEAIELEGNLALGPTGLPVSFSLDGRIAAEDGAPVLLPIPGDPTRVGRIDLSAGFDADAGERWTADLTVSGLDRPGFSAETLELVGTGTIPAPGTPPEAQVFTADLDFSARALDLGDPAAEAALGEAVTGRLSIRKEGDAPMEIGTLSVEGDTYGAEASGTLDFADRDLVIDARLALAARDLSVFSGIAGRTLGGSADLRAEGRGSLLGGDLALRAEGTTRDLTVDIPEVDRLTAGRAGLTVAAARGPSGITIETFELESAAVEATASGAIRSDGTQVDLSARLSDGGLLLPGLAGPLDLSVEVANAAALWTVKGAVAGPALDGAIDGTLDLGAETPAFDGTARIAAPSIAPFGALAGLPDLAGSVDADFDGRVTADLADFDIRMSAAAVGLTTGIEEVDAAHGGRLRVQAAAERTGHAIVIEDAFAQTATARMEVSGRIDARAGPLLPFDPDALFSDPAARFDGALAVSSADLSAFGPILGQDALGGALTLRLAGDLSVDLSDFDLDLTVDAESLATGTRSLDALVSGPVTAVVRAGRADGGAVSLEEVRVGSAAVNARLSGAVTGLPRQLLPEPGAIFDMAEAPVFEGTLSLEQTDLATFSGLAALPGLSGTLRATAEARAAFDLGTAEVRVDATGDALATGITGVDDYLTGRTTLAVDAELADGTVVLREARLANPALEVGGSGTFGADGGRVSANAVLADVGRFVPGLSGAARLSVTAESGSGDAWDVSADATGPGGLTFAANGRVAGDGSDLDLAVTGAAPLELANQFITPRSIEGTTTFDLTVDGPPALGSVSGRIALADARFVDPAFFLVLERIGGAITLAGSRASVDISAGTQGGGAISVTGPISLAPPFSTDLRVGLNGARLSDPQLFETTVNGTIAITGPLTGGAAISGDVALGRTEIRVPAGATGGAAPIPDIVHVGEPADVRATRERAGLLATEEAGGAAGPALGLDVVVRAPGQIFVRGRGLDAELGGQIRVQGTTQDVIPSGQFELLRGRLDILGKRLVLTEGAITLEGSLDPFIRLVAEADADDITVFVTVIGRVSEPEILFSSEPALPDDEILARLLFGQGIQNLSPLQAAQLASAVATLTGRGGEGLVGGLRQGFGLDDLDVTTDGNGNIGVRAGKYLSENVYTDVVVNSDGSSEIELNLDVTPSLTVTGTADNEGDTSIGIFFERDY